MPFFDPGFTPRGITRSLLAGDKFLLLLAMIVGGIVVSLLLWWPFLLFWNRRAKRLAREAVTVARPTFQNIWPPPPNVPGRAP